ncbi:MAG TPA: glycosyltransferase [Planctomycetota bacterium]|nr:glycosyltransferase [Planctomycetota bacterium]
MNAPQELVVGAQPTSTAPALDVSIVVPVQSPAAEVEAVVRALGDQLTKLGRSWECLLVFDGVRGAAWEAAQRLAAEQPGRVTAIGFQQPFGESVCMTAGIERSRGRVILTSPQYVQVDPVDLGNMLAALDAGADVVCPIRTKRIDPLLNRAQSALFNWAIRCIIRGQFHDLNCYLRAFRREVLADVSVYGDLYRFLPVIAHRQGYRVVEVPVRHVKEWGRAGFFGVGVYVRRLLDLLGVVFLTRFTLKPLRFFGSVGIVCGSLGGVILFVLFLQKVLYDAGLYQRPLLTLGLLLVMLGVQIFGFGLVGEIIIYTQARNLRGYRIESEWDDSDPDRSGPA